MHDNTKINVKKATVSVEEMPNAGTTDPAAQPLFQGALARLLTTWAATWPSMAALPCQDPRTSTGWTLDSMSRTNMSRLVIRYMNLIVLQVACANTNK